MIRVPNQSEEAETSPAYWDAGDRIYRTFYVLKYSPHGTDDRVECPAGGISVDIIGNGTIRASHLGSILETYGIDWHYTMEKYFETAYHWFPIMNRRNFDRLVSARLKDHDLAASRLQSIASAEQILLILSMYLATKSARYPDTDNATLDAAYKATKKAWALLCCLSDPAMELMQCGAMITLFELEYGEPRLAFRTLTETLCMASIFGLGAGKQRTDKCIYQRALWWTLFILDQIVHQDPSTQDLPFIVPRPEDDDLLPNTGYLWDGRAYRLFVKDIPSNTPISISLGSFQRAAQAAILLHDAHRWRSRLSQASVLPGVAEFSDLDEKLRDLLNTMSDECDTWEVCCGSFAMCIRSNYPRRWIGLTSFHRSPFRADLCVTDCAYSALLTLYCHYLTPQRIMPDDQMRHETDNNVQFAKLAIKFALQFVTDMASHFNSHLERQSDYLTALTPSITITFFQAAESAFNLDAVAGDSEKGTAEICKALRTFASVSRAANVMLDRLAECGHTVV
ncbi:C6 transcription factor, partial [Metarhizium brunneum ARSEF 3297]